MSSAEVHRALLEMAPGHKRPSDCCCFVVMFRSLPEFVTEKGIAWDSVATEWNAKYPGTKKDKNQLRSAYQQAGKNQTKGSAGRPSKKQKVFATSDPPSSSSGSSSSSAPAAAKKQTVQWTLAEFASSRRAQGAAASARAQPNTPALTTPPNSTGAAIANAGNDGDDEPMPQA
jgi:hypothetical protein